MKSLFGTDGIRTLVGNPPLHEESLLTLSKAIGQWIIDNFGEYKKILIAHDTRISADFIKSSIKSGLFLYPVELYDGGVLPTPTIINLVAKQKLFDIGIIITASHNKFNDNGIKIVTQLGKISDHDERQIEYYYLNKKFKPIDYTKLGKEKNNKPLVQYYTHDIKQQFDSMFLASLSIGIDCAHGATEKIAPALFKFFGAHVTTLGCSSNGININEGYGSTHPEKLRALVVEKKLDLGIAFDGDGDRLIMINKHGIIKDGDDILAILSTHPQYQHQKTIVGTIMSNEGLNLSMQQQNKAFVRTNVGDKYIMEELEKSNNSIGGEPSGHIIVRDFINTSDGIYAALKTMETVLKNNNIELTSFEKMPQITKGIPFKQKKNLDDEPCRNIIDAYKKKLKNGRIIARYSGTEPILRVMVETSDAKDALSIAEQLSQELHVFLNKGIYEHEEKFNRAAL